MNIRNTLFRTATLLTILPAAAHAQTAPNMNVDPKTIVHAEAFPSTDPVVAGKPFEVAVVVHIMDGFHMNSHQPSESYLIASNLTTTPPTGLTAGEVVYPKGKLATFTFSPDKPLDVYEGTVTLHMPVQTAASLPTGAVDLPLTLRYQACNTKACFRPVSIPLTAKLTVAPAGTPIHPVHPDLFPKTR